ncbi:MAG: hypothetical protein M3022_12345 [Actinomycetota bacterium]|nr:hypothetical protein [Actinomycetota bacterium]
MDVGAPPGFLYGSLTFGSTITPVVVGNTAGQTGTITDEGFLPRTVGTLRVTGPDASSFSLSADGCSGQTLEPAQAVNDLCSFSVSFHPAAPGTLTAQVNVPDTGAVSLTGYAKLPGTGSIQGHIYDGTHTPPTPLGQALVVASPLTTARLAATPPAPPTAAIRSRTSTPVFTRLPSNIP